MISAVCAFFVLALAPQAELAQDQDVIEAGPVRVVVEPLWPVRPTKGYRPVRLQVTNTEESTEIVDISILVGWRDDVRLNRSVSVEPLETVKFEMLVPTYFGDQDPFQVEVGIGRWRERSRALGGAGLAGLLDHDIVIFSNSRVPIARATIWSGQLSPKEHSGRLSRGPWRKLGISQDSEWAEKGFISVVDAAFPSMSQDWRAYSGLDFVIVDLTEQAPDASDLEALIAWVRTGGEVAFVGPDVNAALARLEPVAPWLEGRFRLDPTPGSPSVRRYQCGFGRVLVAQTDQLLDDSEFRAAVVKELRGPIKTGWVPSPRGSRGSGLNIIPLISGLTRLPLRAFVLLMVLFGCLVFPVNFYLVKRFGKPVWLLFTIPGIALVSSLLVLVYGLFWQGMDIKTTSTTVAVLDQRNGIADNVEIRALFAGIAPGRGLVPGTGTGVFTWKAGEKERYQIDYREGEERYSSEFLPSRKQVQQVLISDRATRLRVEFDVGGGVVNGLGADIELLVVHAFDGGWWKLDGELLAGEKGQLVSISMPEKPDFDLPAFGASDDWDLPRGSYAARTKTAALRDSAGIKLVDIDSNHSLLGVLGKDTTLPGATQ